MKIRTLPGSVNRRVSTKSDRTRLILSPSQPLAQKPLAQKPLAQIQRQACLSTWGRLQGRDAAKGRRWDRPKRASADEPPIFLFGHPIGRARHLLDAVASQLPDLIAAGFDQ